MEDKIALRQQLFASKAMEELCSLLESMRKDFRGQQISRELSYLIYILKTQRLRHRKDAGAFCRAGGVSSLVRMLLVAEEARDQILLLSTLANVCWLDYNARNQVSLCLTLSPFSHTHLILLCILLSLQVMNYGLEEIGEKFFFFTLAFFSKFVFCIGHSKLNLIVHCLYMLYALG